MTLEDQNAARKAYLKINPKNVAVRLERFADAMLWAIDPTGRRGEPFDTHYNYELTDNRLDLIWHGHINPKQQDPFYEFLKNYCHSGNTKARITFAESDQTGRYPDGSDSAIDFHLPEEELDHFVAALKRSMHPEHQAEKAGKWEEMVNSRRFSRVVEEIHQTTNEQGQALEETLSIWLKTIPRGTQADRAIRDVLSNELKDLCIDLHLKESMDVIDEHKQKYRKNSPVRPFYTSLQLIIDEWRAQFDSSLQDIAAICDQDQRQNGYSRMPAAQLERALSEVVTQLDNPRGGFGYSGLPGYGADGKWHAEIAKHTRAVG